MKRRRRKRPSRQVKTSYFPFKGGLDLLTPNIEMPPGHLLGSQNYCALSSKDFNRPAIVDPPEFRDPKTFFIGDSNRIIISPISSSLDLSDFSAKNRSPCRIIPFTSFFEEKDSLSLFSSSCRHLAAASHDPIMYALS